MAANPLSLEAGSAGLAECVGGDNRLQDERRWRELDVAEDYRPSCQPPVCPRHACILLSQQSHSSGKRLNLFISFFVHLFEIKDFIMSSPLEAV